MPFIEWTPDRQQAGSERNRLTRWDTKARARVVTADGTEVIVPHISNYSAILCAAEILNVPRETLMDAAVWTAAEGMPIGILKGSDTDE